VSASEFRRAVRADPKTLIVHLDRSMSWIKSRFHLDSIWSAALRREMIDDLRPSQQDICFEVRRLAGSVVVRELDEADCAFRIAIRSGLPLAMAGENASLLKPDFAILPALVDLVRSGAVVFIGFQKNADDIG
jgi:hypothetical protein